MKKRSVMSVVIFSIITLGIYDLFWLVSTKKALNADSRVRTHVPTIWILFGPLLAMIPLFFILIVAGAANNGSSNAGFAVISALIDIVLVIAIIFASFYWMFKYCKAVNEYTSGELNTAVTFLLLWLLRFVGLAIIQDKFNEMIDAGQAGGQMAPAAAYAGGPAPYSEQPGQYPQAMPQPDTQANDNNTYPGPQQPSQYVPQPPAATNPIPPQQSQASQDRPDSDSQPPTPLLQ